MESIACQLDDKALALPVAAQEDRVLTEVELIRKLVDWSYLLCAGQENHLAREGMLADILGRLMRVSARIASHLRPLLSKLARWLHTGRHPEIDRAVLISRARP